MELLIADKMRKVVTITPSQAKKLLKDGNYKKNVFLYGKSGIGKSAIVEDYGKECDLTVIPFSLATEMPEAMGGIPHVNNNVLTKLLHSIADKLYKALTKDNSKTNFIINIVKSIKDATETNDIASYFTRLLDQRLAPLFETKGKGYVLFFDEMNQALPEVLNACYSICHPDPKKRHWCGHSLEYAQIVGAGNLNTGEDGTVYLNDIPTPLHNRFHIFEMEADKQDTKDFLEKKWKNIPQVAKYIDVLLAENTPPRDIDEILEVIAYDMDGLWIASKVGEALAVKLLDIQKKIKTVDPAKAYKGCQEIYSLFKKNGAVKWVGTYIKDEKVLIDKFKNILSEEEIKSIIEGGK